MKTSSGLGGFAAGVCFVLLSSLTLAIAATWQLFTCSRNTRSVQPKGVRGSISTILRWTQRRGAFTCRMARRLKSSTPITATSSATSRV